MQSHEQYLEEMREDGERQRHEAFVRIRDVAFEAIKASIPCAEIDSLNAGCERANCVCANAAEAVASALAL